MSNTLSATGTTVIFAALVSAMAFGQARAEVVENAYFVNPLPQFPAWRLIGDCMAERAEELDIDLTETGPTDGTLNTNMMIQQIQQGISNEVDALITFPASDGFVPQLEQAAAADIIVGTLYGAGYTASASQTNVGADFGQIGQIMVEALGGREGDQNVGLLVQGPSGPGNEFEEGFRAAAGNAENVNVIAVAYTEDNPAKALDQSNALLAANPDINVIASHMGTATQGASATIKSRGMVGDVVVLANGAAGGGQEGLEDGTVYRIMMQDLCNAGAQILQGVVDLGEDKEVPAQIDVGIRMFSADEVQEYLDQGWQ
ncbi:sugar ABC transporter substrate-binding protein [Granulosicoccus sp.]|nr:sugar ABC transporter substrate-binding protein [Granulosicoccus sp.]